MTSSSALLVVLVLSLFSIQVYSQLCVSTAGSNITTVIGQPDITSTGSGLPGLTNLSAPTQAVFDPSTSKVYVSDSNHYIILRYASAQAVITHGTAELILFGNTSSACTSFALAYVEQIDVYNDNLYIADASGNRVLIQTAVSTANATLNDSSQVLGSPNTSFCTTTWTTLNDLQYPSGVAVSANGSLFVAVYSDNIVSRFDNVLGAGNYLAPNAIFGTYQSSGINNTQFNGPYYATIDRVNGHLWVSEYTNSRVIFFSSAVTKANGSAADVVIGQQNFTGPEDNSCDGQHLNGVYGVYYDAADDVLFVADSDNYRVLYYNSALTLGNFPNASGVVGFQNTSVCATSGTNPESEFGYPEGVFYANDFPGIFLLVTDNGGNRVARFECANATFTRSPSLSNSVVASSVNPSSVNPSSVNPSSVAASSAVAASSSGVVASSSLVANSSVLASVNASVNASSSASYTQSESNSYSSSLAPSLTASPTSAPSLTGTASNSQSNTPSESNPNPLTASNTPIIPPPAGISIQPAVCGNGNVETGEECDPGSAVPRTKCCTSLCTNLPARAVCGKATSKCTKRPKCAKVLSSRQLQCQAGKPKKVGTKCGKGGIFSRKTCKADGSCSK